MIGLLRWLLVAALAAFVFAVVFVPRRAHLPLDPDEPIAANGSAVAGNARTIYDTNPLLGAFGQPPRPDPDDPKEFQWLIENDRWNNDPARDQMARLVGPLDASRCQDVARKQLIAAVRRYYGTRGREKYSFSLRGPRAEAAMDREWSTPADRRIDAFVRRAIQSGFLHKNEVPANVYPEFATLFADTSEIGAACPPLKADDSLAGLIAVHPRSPGPEASYAMPPEEMLPFAPPTGP
jgi:hypothetical protein